MAMTNCCKNVRLIVAEGSVLKHMNLMTIRLSLYCSKAQIKCSTYIYAVLETSSLGKVEFEYLQEP